MITSDPVVEDVAAASYVIPTDAPAATAISAVDVALGRVDANGGTPSSMTRQTQL